MQTKVLNAREIREKRVLFRAPLAVVPVLVLLFWFCGGGRGRAFAAAHGFDMVIPAAHVVSITKTDKMGYYEKAKRDSVAARQRARMEASYAKVLGIDSAHSPEVVAKEVLEKVEAVKKALAAGRSGARLARSPAGTYDRLPRMPAPDLSRLERIASSLQHDDAGGAEISGLAAVVEKLAALQAPKRDSGVRRREVVPQRPVSVVRALPDAGDSLLDDGPLRREGALPGGALRGGEGRSWFDSSVIEAIVPEEQVLVSGGELKLELVRDILVDGRRIVAGTTLFGIVSLSGERLRVAVSAVACQGRVFPLQLQVDDEDGLAGIYIPGAPMMDASRESVSSEIGAVGPTVVSTGLAGQAANAGITLTRSLIGKKVRPVWVTVPAGYHVLLHPKNEGL